VLVLARTGRIDGLEDVALQPVTQLRAKLDAAVRDGRFDTVVVVGQTALDETERILTELRPRTPLRVRSIASAAPAPPPPATL
jgi:GTP cyclohydrolase III